MSSTSSLSEPDNPFIQHLTEPTFELFNSCQSIGRIVVPSLLRGSAQMQTKLFKQIWEKTLSIRMKGSTILLKGLPLPSQKTLAPRLLETIEKQFLEPFLKIKIAQVDFLTLDSFIDFALLNLFVYFHEKTIDVDTGYHPYYSLLAITEKETYDFAAIFSKWLEASSLSDQDKQIWASACRTINALQRLSGCHESSCRELLNRQEQIDDFAARKQFTSLLFDLIPRMNKCVHALQKTQMKDGSQVLSQLLKMIDEYGILKPNLSSFVYTFNSANECFTSHHPLTMRSIERNLSKVDLAISLDQVKNDLKSLNLKTDLKVGIFLKKLDLFSWWLASSSCASKSTTFPTSVNELTMSDLEFIQILLIEGYCFRLFGESIKEVAHDDPLIFSIEKGHEMMIEIYTLIIAYLEVAQDLPYDPQWKIQIAQKASTELTPHISQILEHFEEMRYCYVECQRRAFYNKMNLQAPFLPDRPNALPTQPFHQTLLANLKIFLERLDGNIKNTELIKQVKEQIKEYTWPKVISNLAEVFKNHANIKELNILNCDEYNRIFTQSNQHRLMNKAPEIIEREDQVNELLTTLIRTQKNVLLSSSLYNQILYPLIDECMKGLVKEEVDPSDLAWLEEIDKEEELISEVSTEIEQEEHEEKEEVKSHQSEQSSLTAEMTSSSPRATIPTSPFDSMESRLIAFARIGIAKHYKIEKEMLAPHDLWKKNVSSVQTARMQLLYALDLLQWTLEQWEHNQDPKADLFLQQRYKMSLQLAYEQLLTAEYFQMNRSDQGVVTPASLTHDLSFMLKELHLTQPLSWLRKKKFGTNEFRYPSSFKTTTHKISKQEIQADLNEFVEVVKSLNIPLEIPSDPLELHPLEKEGTLDAVCLEMAQRLEKVKKQFDQFLKTIPQSPSKKKFKALANCKNHLANLTLIPSLIRQFPYQRFLHNHLWEALFSTQYFAENLGVALSMKSGKEFRTHDLILYASKYGLGDGLKREDQATLKGINARKSSEYPYNYLNPVEGMIVLSDRYCRSRNATIAGEGFRSFSIKEMSLGELQKEDLQLIEKMGHLVENLVKIHCLN